MREIYTAVGKWNVCTTKKREERERERERVLTSRLFKSTTLFHF